MEPNRVETVIHLIINHKLSFTSTENVIIDHNHKERCFQYRVSYNSREVTIPLSTYNSSLIHANSPEQFADELNGVLGHQVLVIRIDETVPGLPGVPPQDAVEVRVQFQVVLVQILKQFVCTEHLICRS